MVNYNEILRYFPLKIGMQIDKELKQDANYNVLEEIRLRSNRPLMLKLGQTEKIIDVLVETKDILETLQHACDNSIYSYQRQICEGYITVKGGHRIGITGSAVVQDGKITNMNYISNLNFRIARQVIGCSTKLLQYVIDIQNDSIFNTLIISPPGAGKTTILRDLIRKISDGMEQIKFVGKTVGVVDERGEIAASYKGVAQNDVGMRTDVLDNIAKADGMKMLIRSMAPQIIVADEIGSKEDVEAIDYAICCGIKGIFTAHGGSLEDVKLNPALEQMIQKHVFERLIFLDRKNKGNIDKVYSLNKINAEYILI